jgi:hypothetical protein
VTTTYKIVLRCNVGWRTVGYGYSIIADAYHDAATIWAGRAFLVVPE